jgi:hypothetical protein
MPDGSSECEIARISYAPETPYAVKVDEVFRTWIGLHPSISDDEIDRRRVEKRLGTLVIPVSIGGHTERKEFRL